MSRPALTQTTLSAALDASARVFALGSTTGINGSGSLTTEQSCIVIGSELMLVQRVPVAGTVEVIRGFGGTRAKAHASGVRVFAGARSAFSFAQEGADDLYGLVGLTGDPGSLPSYRLPVGVVVFNPDDGNEYRLCDVQQAADIGEWQVIDGNGLASDLASTSKGRVGIIVETVGGSDTLSWLLVAGTTASAKFTSNVTTACYLKAGAAIADILDSDGGNVIWGATCTAGPSSATDLGTVYLDHPWVTGVEVAFSSIGE